MPSVYRPNDEEVEDYRLVEEKEAYQRDCTESNHKVEINVGVALWNLFCDGFGSIRAYYSESENCEDVDNRSVDR